MDEKKYIGLFLLKQKAITPGSVSSAPGQKRKTAKLFCAVFGTVARTRLKIYATVYRL